jgi:hypothetical protein
MNPALFCRGRTAGAVIVGSAGTKATAKAAKGKAERADKVYRPDIVGIRFAVEKGVNDRRCGNIGRVVK